MRHLFKRLITTFLLAVVCALNYTQAQDFKKSENFVADVDLLFSKTKVDGLPDIIAGIKTQFESGLTAEQKTLFLDICQRMQKKRVRPDYHFRVFFGSIVFGKESGKLSEELTTKFLQVTDTTLNELNVDYAAKMHVSTYKFFKENFIYTYKDYNQVEVLGGSFDFGYGREASIGEVKEEEEVWMPDTSSDTEDTSTDSDGFLTETTTSETSTDDGWGDSGSSSSTTSDDDWGWGDDSSSSSTSSDGWGDASEWESTDDWGTEGWGDESSSSSVTEEEAFEKENLPPVWDDAMPVAMDEIEADKIKLAGPYIRLDSVQFSFYTKDDTATIRNTSGEFLFANGKFNGRGGRFDWSGVGLSPSEVFCDFSTYVLEVKHPEITAKSANLSYKSKIDTLVNGKFEYKSSRVNNTAEASYPRFRSYYNNVKVNDIVKFAVYEGGFSLFGKQISSFSFSHGSSKLSIVKDGETKMKIFSKDRLVINEKSVTSKRSKLAIYFKQDSLMHPAVILRYDAEKGMVTARKDKKEYKNAPFIDSYHMMTIAADYLEWNIEEDSFHLGIVSGRTEIPAILESEARFDSERFDNMQGLYTFHPLLVGLHYATQVLRPATLKFDAANLAKAMKLNEQLVKESFKEMAQGGYVDYYEAQGRPIVTILRKGVLYARAAKQRNLHPSQLKQGFIDYDNIAMRSLSGDMKNMTFKFDEDTVKLVVKGVERITLSSTDAIRVEVEPLNQIVTIKQNRDMEFGGKVFAKNFIFNGKVFNFHYDEFKIDMPKIDSLQFVVQDTIQTNPRVITKDSILENSIKDVSGVFYISHPKNKSGLIPMEKYPIFESGTGGDVRFNGSEILGGAYQDSLIHFEVDKFRLDSISKLKPEEMNFAGRLKTNGLLPDIDEPIHVMDDGSLGFIHDVPDEGYDLFSGRAKINNGNIILNNNGIRAGSQIYEEEGRKYVGSEESAQVSYLSATLESNDFTFYSDHVVAMDSKEKLIGAWSKGTIKAGTLGNASFPPVDMPDYKLFWESKSDTMNLTTTDKLFNLYEPGSTEFEGNLKLSPGGLNGDGIVETKEAYIKSPLLAFQEKQFTGSQSHFVIKSNDVMKPAVEGNPIRFNYDRTLNRVAMTSEKVGQSSFTFPYSQYQTSLGEAIWNIEEKNIAFRLGEGIESQNQRFTSIHPDQAGLSFAAAHANYNIETYVLEVGGVPYIEVVDCHIYPNEGKVLIQKDANMEPLKDSRILFNATTRYYEMEKGDLKIHSKERFSGEATYNYINDVDQMFNIRFGNFEKEMLTETMFPDSLKEKISYDKLLNTRGSSTYSNVEEKDNFIMSDGTQFKGKVFMKAWLPTLEFQGQIRLTLDGPNSPWIPLQTGAGGGSGGTSTVIVSNETVNNQPLALGVYIDKSSHQIYTPLMEAKRSNRDHPVFMANGVLTPNSILEKNVIMTPEKKANSSIKGNRFEYSSKRSEIEFEGTMNLIESDNKLQFSATGLGKGKYKENTYEIQSMLCFKFGENEEVMRAMADEIEGYLEENRSKYSIKRHIKKSKVLTNQLAELVEEKDVQGFNKRFTPGKNSINDVLGDKALVLSDVKLKWVPDQKTFVSVGSIGVSNIFKRDIDALVDGKVEVNIETGSVHVYMEYGPGRWYYISYSEKEIHITASTDELKAILENPKLKDKIKIAEKTEVDRFIMTFNNKYSKLSLSLLGEVAAGE